MAKTGIVRDPLPIAPIDFDNKRVLIRPSQAESTRGKSVFIEHPQPEVIRFNNDKTEDHVIKKDKLSSSNNTKKPKLTFEMLKAKYKKGLADQRFDYWPSNLKRPRSSLRKRFGQMPKQSEQQTISTP